MSISVISRLSAQQRTPVIKLADQALHAKLKLVDAHEVNSGGGLDPSSEPFEDPRFQALSVPVALEVMLATIDRCRHMMHDLQVPSAFAVSAPGQRNAMLSSRERRSLDAVISSYWADLEKNGRAELAKYGLLESGEGESIYPLAEETVLTVQSVILRSISERLGKEHFAKYATEPAKAEYILANLRLGSKTDRESTAGTVLVPFLVSKLEDFLGALVRVTLILHPTALGVLPDIPNVIYQRYKAHLSSSDILRWQIDEKVVELLRKSTDDWRSVIKKRMNIDIGGVGTDWSRINELIQRRHVITHNNGRVDDDYMTRVQDNLRVGLVPGDRLLSSAHYMTPTLLEVETWSICLAVKWSKHFFAGEARYHPLIIGRVVELEDSSNWSQALTILNAYLSEPLPSSLSEVSLGQINRWFCQQELGYENNTIEKQILSWTPQGNDAEDILLAEIGRSALLRDYNELVMLLRRGIGSGMASLRKETLHGYPLIKRAMRESPSVASLVQGTSASHRYAPSRTRRRSKNR